MRNPCARIIWDWYGFEEFAAEGVPRFTTKAGAISNHDAIVM